MTIAAGRDRQSRRYHLNSLRPSMVTTMVTTAAERAELPDDGYGDELIRGDLIRPSSTGFEHLDIVGLLIYQLRAYVMPRDVGVVGGEGGFVLERDPETVLAPDVVFVRDDRLPPKGARKGFLESAPDLAVEVLAPSDRAGIVNDRVLIYADAGVRLVLIADPAPRIVTVREPDRTARVFAVGDELDGGEGLPGFRLPVAELYPQDGPAGARSSPATTSSTVRKPAP